MADWYLREDLASGSLAGASGPRELLDWARGVADRAAARKFCAQLYGRLNASSATDALVDTAGLKPSDADINWLLSHLARHLVSSSYRYTETVSKPKPPLKLRKVTVPAG